MQILKNKITKAEIQHKELADGRWSLMSISEQLANVGSEVSRALNWRKKNREEYFQKAFNRAMELLSLTIAAQTSLPRINEMTRLRECLLDYFYNDNSFKTSESILRKYFDHFAIRLQIQK